MLYTQLHAFSLLLFLLLSEFFQLINLFCPRLAPMALIRGSAQSFYSYSKLSQSIPLEEILMASQSAKSSLQKSSLFPQKPIFQKKNDMQKNAMQKKLKRKNNPHSLHNRGGDPSRGADHRWGASSHNGSQVAHNSPSRLWEVCCGSGWGILIKFTLNLKQSDQEASCSKEEEVEAGEWNWWGWWSSC